MQEWTEHVRDDAAQRIEKGADPDAAEEAAWKALGEVDVLTASAVRELAQASWLGRHPWLGGMAMPFLGWVVVLAAVLFLSAPVIGWLVDHDTNSPRLNALLVCWQYVFNWLPWLVAVSWLARIARRMPGGWKLFWITAITLSVLSPSLRLWIVPRSHGPGTGQILFFWPTGLLGCLAGTLVQLFGYAQTMIDHAYARIPKWETRQALIQSALMLLGTIVFYLQATRTRKVFGAAVVSGWLGMCWILQHCSAQGFVL
jgi:hypothetical protein